MEQMERVILCVDDTDDLTKETSTGKVAELIAALVVELGGTVELGITRHQLLLDESVPYTSHNSSMAFTALMPRGLRDELWQRAVGIVHGEMSAAADPGLCVGYLASNADDPVLYELVDFGRRAKTEYVSKAQALELAGRIPWLRLEELGGDGQGVVGALAGVGLRLSGSDGRFRGRLDMQAALSGAANARQTGGKGKGRGDGSGGGKHRKRDSQEVHARQKQPQAGSVADGQQEAAAAGVPQTALVSRLCDVLGEQVNGRVAVVDASGNRLALDTPVLLSSEAKPALFAGCLSIMTKLGQDGVARPCGKEDFEDMDECLTDLDCACPLFEFDNDQEEYGATDGIKACPNCLYRRWTAGGFTCMRQAQVRSFSEVMA